MTTPSTWRRRAQGSPWPRRLARAIPSWLIALTVLAALDVEPSVPLAAAILLAGFGITAAFDEPTADETDTLVAEPYLRPAGRGADHATLALGSHLARLHTTAEGNDQLAAHVQARLRAILEAHVWRTHGVELARHTEWASRLLPADLAACYTAPVDPRVLHPKQLGPLLTRLEDLCATAESPT